jgi:hypothetical protein
VFVAVGAIGMKEAARMSAAKFGAALSTIAPDVASLIRITLAAQLNESVGGPIDLN